MNTACPTCGAIYNVAAKDIGRKLKCKKCSTALKVTEEGLEVDSGGTGSAPPAESSKTSPVPAAVADDDEVDEEPVVKKKKGKYERSGPRVNPLDAIGGVPTLLFGIGVFFVILFTALPIIGAAGTVRDKAYLTTLKLDRDAEYKDKEPKKKEKDWSDDDRKKLNEEKEKIDEKYKKLFEDAARDAERTENRNVRLTWYEQYGLMFGFMFVAFGCIAFLRTEQPLIMKIVAATILAVLMIVMFGKFAGCRGVG